MITANTHNAKREGKMRRKALLRTFREDEEARMWNKIMDEVGPCGITEQDRECDSLDFLDPVTDPELLDIDEDYPNKVETLHNIFECD
jgi:hypothetical protein